MLFASVASGESFTLPAGFVFASISPGASTSFTITNSLSIPPATGVTNTSPAISGVYSFPLAAGSSGWDAHEITATGGTVVITYSTGR